MIDLGQYDAIKKSLNPSKDIKQVFNKHFERMKKLKEELDKNPNLLTFKEFI